MPGSNDGGIEWPNLPDEPEGWRELQKRARNEPDPKKLEAIIAEMNELLSEHEKRAAANEAPQPASPPNKAKPPSNPE
ncbi:MAG: hypothetical protein ABSG02_04805 [Terriglobales bacterium]|jgi:hypothetical protein